MKSKIVCTAILGIAMAIIVFYFIMNWYQSNFDPTYIWIENIKNKSNTPKVLLFGSSHTGALNTDYIQEYIGSNYEVYNLAIASDYPTRRIETLAHIIELKPKMILYGIEIRMFEGQPSVKQEQLTALQIIEINSVLPSAKEFFENILFPLTANDFFSKIPKSPKIITLQTIKHFVRDSNQTITLNVDSNRPFYNIEKNIDPVIDLEILKKDQESQNMQFHGIDPQNNREWDTLKKIIKELKHNNIKVVIFATPKSSVYINWFTDENKIIFDQMLEEIADTGTIVYSKYDMYQDYNIWSDPVHVTQGKSGIVYSEDIAKIIVNELKK